MRPGSRRSSYSRLCSSSFPEYAASLPLLVRCYRSVSPHKGVTTAVTLDICTTSHRYQFLCLNSSRIAPHRYHNSLDTSIRLYYTQYDSQTTILSAASTNSALMPKKKLRELEIVFYCLVYLNPGLFLRLSLLFLYILLRLRRLSSHQVHFSAPVLFFDTTLSRATFLSLLRQMTGMKGIYGRF